MISETTTEPVRHTRKSSYPRPVKIWLIIGLVMVFFQIVIGGITRLTESGLSITKWEVITGTLPPLSQEAWQEAFELYQDSPQYEKINQGMSMSDFKFIYFWEYIHRLWARAMGFVFLIPFVIFWRKGWLDAHLLRRLGITVLLAALAASFGWIMVASGLIDRPWVNAYKLTVHLSLGITLFGYLLWTTFQVVQPQKKVIHNNVLKRGMWVLLVVLAIQIILGGIMSGMKAALFYPTWPDMQGVYLPDILLDPSAWNVENFVQYDKGPFMAALVQFLHRNAAYLLTIIVLWFAWCGFKAPSTPAFRLGLKLLVSVLIIQVALGIITVINSVGTVPVLWGVLHQAVAILLVSAVLFVRYQMQPTAS